MDDREKCPRELSLFHWLLIAALLMIGFYGALRYYPGFHDRGLYVTARHPRDSGLHR